jgi:post-segregation antitoxin (ccd killing protein)
MEKTNLTVRINKEVLEKAKKIGLNLSATTEVFLKAASLINEKKLVSSEELREAYQEVFQDIIKILKKRGITWYVKIGEYSDEVEFRDSDGKTHMERFTHFYYLTPDGRIEDYIDEPIGETIRSWKLNEDWPVTNISNSQQILSELVDTIYRSSQNNKTKLEDLSILRSVIQELKTDKKK